MKTAPATVKTAFWRRAHHLDRMTLGELVAAYFRYPAIIAYLALALVAAGLAAWRPSPVAPMLAAVGVSLLIYPLVWYCLHRWVLHSKWMWKHSALAATWKRIHYDHHQDPNHLEVLFGALHTTLPTIAVATVPIGWAIGSLWGAGFGAAMAALATGLLTTCFYEFCHCIQHLAYSPKNPTLAMMKRRHMAHHFHDETGNFGITNYAWDRLFGTLYERVSDRTKSPTVFNLGYDEDVAARYPWVARLSGGVATGHPVTRIRAARAAGIAAAAGRADRR